MSEKLVNLIGIPVVGLHQGQRTYAPRQQAGHMTAADQIVRNAKKCLPRGRPHMTPRKCLGFKTPFQAILAELGKDVKIRFA
jgi:hypothetical protein